MAVLRTLPIRRPIRRNTWDLYVGPLRAKTVTFPSRTHSYSSLLLLLLLLLLLVLLLILLYSYSYSFSYFYSCFSYSSSYQYSVSSFGTYTGDLYAGNAAGYLATTGLRMLKWLYAGYTWHVVRWVPGNSKCTTLCSYALVALFVK